MRLCQKTEKFYTTNKMFISKPEKQDMKKVKSQIHLWMWIWKLNPSQKCIPSHPEQVWWISGIWGDLRFVMPAGRLMLAVGRRAQLCVGWRSVLTARQLSSTPAHDLRVQGASCSVFTTQTWKSHRPFRRVLVVKLEETPEELKKQEIPRGCLGDFLTDERAEWPIKCLTVRYGTALNGNELEARRASGCVQTYATISSGF